MKNHIKVVSRHKFIELVKEGLPLNMAFISIHEPRNKIIGGHVEAWPTILPEADNVLNLWFNDCEEENVDIEAVLFNEDMATQIIEFVEKNKTAKGWLLHCTMGKSRSGAIGSFLSDYFEINWFDFLRDNPQVSPNALVRKLLTKVLNEKFAK